MASLSQSDMLTIVIDGAKEQCTADATGNYKVTELLEHALSLRNHLDRTLFGPDRAQGLEVVDAFVTSLMTLLLAARAAATAARPPQVVTPAPVPKPVQLKPHRKVKKKEVEAKKK